MLGQTFFCPLFSQQIGVFGPLWLGWFQGQGKFWWGKNSKINFSLAIEIPLLCGQYKLTIGQSTFVPVGKRCCAHDVHRHKTNYQCLVIYLSLFWTVSDVAPKPCPAQPLAKSPLNRVPLFWLVSAVVCGMQ